MSGEVGPCRDKHLPKEEHQEPYNYKASVPKESHRAQRGVFTFRHLSALAVAVVLSAGGMVSLGDIAFVLFSLVYVHLLSKVAFPTTAPTMERPVFVPKNKTMGFYVFIAALIGLVLPIAFILEGILEGDQKGVKAAAPHVFLLASQVVMEGLTYTDKFSLPIWVFVPVFYNSRRIFTIVDWMSEISEGDEEYGGGEWRLNVGRALAVANMALWCFNLFGFLLPVFLPKAFKIYYGGSKH